MKLVVDADKCRGCRRCEMACAWREDSCNPRMASVRIVKDEAAGKDRPFLSQQCLDSFCGRQHPFRNIGEKIPACASACLFGGISVERS